MTRRCLLSAAVATGFLAVRAEYSLDLDLDKPSGIYAVGERATVRVRLLDDGRRVTDKRVKWRVRSGTNPFTELDLANAQVSGTRETPGRMCFEFRVYEPDGKTPVRDASGSPVGIVTMVGALFSPEKLAPNRDEPADFDAYWQGEIARDRAACPFDPSKATVIPVGKSASFVTREVLVPTGRSRPACCCYSVPVGAAPKSLPLFVRVCGAGILTAGSTGEAGLIDFCISPHGCPRGREQSIYFKEGHPGYRYQFQHWEDREKCYFHDQIIRDIRALEWAKTIPEWNGRDIIVHGVSMGGSQTVQLAALDPDVTFAAIGDPALCDLAGGALGTDRLPGWPQFAQTNLAAVATSAYFDNVFFARRIRCPVQFFTGLVDFVCNPEGQMLCYNAIRTQKSLTTDPLARHVAVSVVPLWRHLAQFQGVPMPAMWLWVRGWESNAWKRALHKFRREKESGRLPEGPVRIFIEQLQHRDDLPWTIPADLSGTARNPIVVTAADRTPFRPVGGKLPTRLFKLEPGVRDVTFENFDFKKYGPDAVEWVGGKGKEL